MEKEGKVKKEKEVREGPIIYEKDLDMASEFIILKKHFE